VLSLVCIFSIPSFFYRYVFAFILLSGLLFLSPYSCNAATKIFDHTVDQPFSGSQSPDDAYMAAMTKAKFEVLELAGTYLESLSVVENAILTKDEVTALAGGILATEVVKKENYATDKTFGILLSTRIEVNTDILHQRMDKLLQDRTLLHKYNEIQEREQELLARIRLLEQTTRILGDATPGPESFNNEFSAISTALTASGWLEKAIALWSNGQFGDPDRAIEYLSRAIALDGQNPRTFNSRAVAYLNIGKLPEAEEDLTTALRQNPNFADAHNNMGSLHYRQGDYQKAIASYTLAVDNQPNCVEAILNRGMASRKLFNFEDAFEDFRRAMLLAPSTFSKNNDAGSLVELNDIERMCDKSQTACRMGLCRSFNFLRQRGFCLQENTAK
jgi:tetratricopeptide (TPR) repeat protein